MGVSLNPSRRSFVGVCAAPPVVLSRSRSVNQHECDDESNAAQKFGHGHNPHELLARPVCPLVSLEGRDTVASRGTKGATVMVKSGSPWYHQLHSFMGRRGISQSPGRVGSSFRNPLIN